MRASSAFANKTPSIMPPAVRPNATPSGSTAGRAGRVAGDSECRSRRTSSFTARSSRVLFFAECAGDLVDQWAGEIVDEGPWPRRHDHFGGHAGLQIELDRLDVLGPEADPHRVVAASGLL